MAKVDTEDIKKEDRKKEEKPSKEDPKEADQEAVRQPEESAGEAAEAGAEKRAEADAAGEGAEAEGSDKAAKEPEEDGDARYLRLMADFQNYKRRVEKEKTDLYSYANEKLIGELLDVLDNFERALEQESGGDGFKEGMEMIFKQLGNVLEKAGLAEIAALGEEFDPNVHNAVMTEETDEYESGKVSGVMQKGYTLNGKVIRPSMVKVVG